jgi:hypothetical protein
MPQPSAANIKWRVLHIIALDTPAMLYFTAPGSAGQGFFGSCFRWFDVSGRIRSPGGKPNAAKQLAEKVSRASLRERPVAKAMRNHRRSVFERLKHPNSLRPAKDRVSWLKSHPTHRFLASHRAFIQSNELALELVPFKLMLVCVCVRAEAPTLQLVSFKLKHHRFH